MKSMRIIKSLGILTLFLILAGSVSGCFTPDCNTPEYYWMCRS
ncbi:MAG: hypothetical protein ACR2PJ_00705 [Pseudomonadales bacterium]